MSKIIQCVHTVEILYAVHSDKKPKSLPLFDDPEWNKKTENSSTFLYIGESNPLQLVMVGQYIFL